MTVGERYVDTLGLDIQRGRTLTDEDTQAVLVNETLVNHYFKGEEPLGRRLWSPATANAPRRGYEIVGVIADTRIFRIRDEPRPLAYFSWQQAPFKPRNTLVFSTTVAPASAIPSLHRQLQDFDPSLALMGVQPLTEIVQGTLFDQRMNAELCSVLALLGLAMAAAGVFSLMSLIVGRRTREIGIRMALGAGRGNVVGLVVGQAMGMVGLGLMMGLAAAWAAARLLKSLLYGVEGADPLAFAAGTAILLSVTVLASFPATRRAASVDPIQSLRSE